MKPKARLLPTGATRLEARGVDHLVVNNQLATTVIDDKDTDGATPFVEGIADAAVQVVLSNNGETGLDITALGESNEAVVADVEDAVGLVDGAEHGLDDNRGGWVGDEAGLLVKLAGEQVDTKVAVLASLGRGGDADHLGGAALQDQNVASTNEVAGDRNGLGGGGANTGLDNADILANTNWAPFVSDNYFFAVIMVIMVTMVTMVMMVVEGVRDAVDSAFHTTTEGVVVTVVVVVTHFASFRVINYGSSLENFDVVAGRSGGRLDTLYTNPAVVVRLSAGNF